MALGQTKIAIQAGRKLLEKLIKTENQTFNNRKTFSNLAKEAGFSGATKPSQFTTSYGKGSLPKLNTAEQNVRGAFKSITKNVNQPVEKFTHLFDKIKNITGVKGSYVGALLKKEPDFKKIEGPYRHLMTLGGKEKFLNKNLTFKDVINNYNIRTKKGTIKIGSGFHSPETKIMDYARRHVDQGGNKIEWLVRPTGASSSNYTKAKFIYNDELYDLTKLKDVGRKDKNFKEFYNVFDRRKKLLNKSDGIIDPRTGNPIKFGKLMEDTYGKKNPFEIDHKMGVKNDPFNNLRLLDARTNNAGGQVVKQAELQQKGLLTTKANRYTPENEQKLLEKFGYNYDKADEQIINDGLDLASKVLIQGRTLRKPLDIAVDRFKLKDGGNVEKANVDGVFREFFDLGGLAGGSRGSNLGRVSGGSLGGVTASNNKVGTIQSILSGIAAGLIDIPKGAFTLGASLMDLGMGSNNASRVENWFDDLTTFDEKAEASTAGSLARIFTNLGIPGSQGWKIGSSLAKKAVTSKRAGNYFKVSRPDMEGRMQEALTTGGKLLTTAGGAAGIGVADAIFVGDPESVGTLGDAFSVGPTQLDPNSDTDPSREILNRIKFGLDSSLMLGVIGGTGTALGKVIARNKGLESNNKTLDKLFSYLRPRGDKPQEFFNLERQQLGIRQADLGRAQELQRNVDRHIDKIFPFIKGALNRTKTTDRADLMKQLNDTLLSGELIDDVAGGLKFTPMNDVSRATSIKRLKRLGAGQKEIDGIFNAFEDMRTEWGDMFGYLGKKMSADDLASFKKGFGKKFGDYLGSTYEVFKNKSLIPMFNFAPGREAIKKGMDMFKDSAKKSGKNITDEQAEYYVNQVVESARPAQQLSTKAEQNAGVFFNAPDFFANKTTLHELDFKGKGLAVSALKSGKKGADGKYIPGSKDVIEEILGKVDDPMSTMLAGTGKLSLLTRRNQFFDKLLEESNLATELVKDASGKMVPKYPDKKRMFFDDEAAAVEALGNGNVKLVGFDPGGKMQIGSTAHNLNGMYAHKGIADALSETSTNILGEGMLSKLYQNLILYPKATSQLAKTVLSPITHVRNVVSAGAFATANGIFFPVEGKAMKEAYKMLQFGARGDAEANAMYQKLLKLGVVNTNVRLGDLQRLLTDVKFGEGTSNMTALRGLTKKLSKLKKGAEDLYTAEDDFWKITSWAVERNRYDKAFRKAGLTDLDTYAKTKGFNKYGDFLDETAADIVRNNIPNYDYVNEFVKGLRKLPLGNFVSFPAEIMRTSGNILSRAFREISEEITLPDGRKIKPFSGIGYKRLIGFGATTVAVPAAVTETFKMAYDVSGDEMDALRRFVPEWSKNSTLVPIRDKETGNLKYVDFSHANAYDTMVRPFVTMMNNVRDGAKDEAPVMESLMRGMFEATKELGSPFISEAIWTQAATDIIVRKGKTPTGQRLYTEQTPVGEKIQKIVGHLVESQLPGSIESFKRLDLAIEPIDIIQKGKFDKYGKTYELGDELAGFVGLRAVEVNPANAMKFKIADFRTGVNNARREFTQPLLKGGPVTPEQIVDRYQIANEQTYKVQQNMLKDYYAARVLGTGESVLDREFKDRVSNIQLNAIKTGRFRPFIPSENIVKSFEENARAIGQRSPFTAAQREIERLLQQYNNLPLTLEQFPISVNPFSSAPELPTAGMEFNGGTLPKINTTLQGSNIGGINNIGNTLAKIEQVDKVFDL